MLISNRAYPLNYSWTVLPAMRQWFESFEYRPTLQFVGVLLWGYMTLWGYKHREILYGSL